MSSTQEPMTLQAKIIGLALDIMNLDLSDVHAQECCIGLGHEIERQAGILHEQTVLGIGNHAMRLIAEEMIPTETPEEKEALDEFERLHPELVAEMDQRILTEAKEIEASHVHSCFAPALDLVRPPEGMSA